MALEQWWVRCVHAAFDDWRMTRGSAGLRVHRLVADELKTRLELLGRGAAIVERGQTQLRDACEHGGHCVTQGRRREGLQVARQEGPRGRAREQCGHSPSRPQEASLARSPVRL